MRMTTSMMMIMKVFRRSSARCGTTGPWRHWGPINVTWPRPGWRTCWTRYVTTSASPWSNCATTTLAALVVMATALTWCDAIGRRPRRARRCTLTSFVTTKWRHVTAKLLTTLGYVTLGRSVTSRLVWAMTSPCVSCTPVYVKCCMRTRDLRSCSGETRWTLAF